MRAILAAALLLGGCTTSQVAGFDAVAAAGGPTIAITGIGPGRSGGFRLGTDGSGRFTRASDSVTRERGVDGVTLGRTLRYGHTRFVATAPALTGTLAGDCRFARGQAQVGIGGTSIAAPVEPLAYECAFRRDGAVVGTLRLAATAAHALPDTRAGTVVFGPTRLDLHSVHAVAGTPIGTNAPAGYRMVAPDGTAAMLDLNGIASARLATPADPALREAALAAALALALTWDPGDVD